MSDFSKQRCPADPGCGKSWIALPAAQEEIASSFQHFDADVLPVVAEFGVTARIIAESAFGAGAPVDGLSEWFYAEVIFDEGRPSLSSSSFP